MHGLIDAQTSHIGKLNAGRTLREHHTAVEQRLEGYKLGLLRGLDFLDEHIQWETDPWYDHRPGFHAAMSINAFLKRRHFHDAVEVEDLRLVHRAFHFDGPG